ncbi:flavodoxin family protein [Tenacibaculum sp. MEBiC06402]|uniref:flavodoxin family protein n=1 Tax=unclassified Tenacibaculum TaxID=2635139 RepID=UPI003B9D66AA
MKKTVIIKASSRFEGNTKKVINYLNTNSDFDVIELLDKRIGHFNYNFENKDDDFIPLMEEIIKKYETIVFATPVYWYTMSGILKVFFDRMSDLLHYKKEIGRKLRGKKMAMISNSAEDDRREGFEMPFKESAKYLGMEYIGDTHVFFSNNEIAEAAKVKLNQLKNSLI